MDEVNESVSKMACKNCGEVIVKNNNDGFVTWRHEGSWLLRCGRQNPWEDHIKYAEPEQAMSS